MNKPVAIVCDIDGTIADDKKRKSNSKNEYNQIDWEKYFDPQNIIKDKVNEELKVKLIEYKKYGKKVIFLTGRPSYLYDKTMLWLFINDIPVDLLVMRDLSDFCYLNIEDFKTRRLAEILKLYDIEIAFDDLDDGIRACKNNNIKCEQIKIKE